MQQKERMGEIGLDELDMKGVVACVHAYYFMESPWQSLSVCLSTGSRPAGSLTSDKRLEVRRGEGDFKAGDHLVQI